MDLTELGRRAVACKHWRWMNGMLLLPHAEGCECCEDRNFPRRAARLPSVFPTEVNVPEVDLPDLSDPATLGCLLHLVQAAWNAARISLCFSAVTPNPERTWVVPISYLTIREGMRNEPSFYGRTQGEALVAALEVAP